MFIQGLNNKFGNILQKVRSFFLRFFFSSNGRLLEAGFLPRTVNKIAIFSVQIGGWAFIRAWAFNRDFTLHVKIKKI